MIYLDYNATTPLCDEARGAMLPYLERHFGNPSSVHAAGRDARAAVDEARDNLARLLHVKPHEIIFTNGGTESCNLAVLGLARCLPAGALAKAGRSSRGGHIISNRAEHHAVLNAAEHLEKHEGFEVTWLNVSRDGIIDLDQLAAALRPDTRLVSIMTANNETGVIQPMREVSQICRERGALLHSDMVQSFGKIETDLSLVDAASFAAHKFYGPKGAGFLFLRSGLSIQPIMFGGAHENERRPGTENVPAIAGMAAAAEWTSRDREEEQQRETKLHDELWTRISQNVPDAKQNGANAPRLANTLNISLLGVDSETLLIALDLEGVCASSGSACMVGSVVASHVLLAMGLPIERARSAVRFSLGKWTTAEEIKATGDAVQKIVERLQTRKSAYAVA
ncbi:MAG: cysteine desulfurase NifS [Verrucomicrobia bacterium]|nr:MAG: cysteine desulfurase NifS [Verrucomicrobiota bacterium]PYL69454.1 MAG: cysteine desulfurase NifS [Verrucomicrobiota bacterium]